MPAHLSFGVPNGCQPNPYVTLCDVPENILQLSPDGCLILTAEDLAAENPSVVTLLVDNNDGTFTYTNEDDVDVIIDACKLISDGGCLPTLEAGPNAHQYTFNDGHGTSTIIDVNEIDFDVNDVEVIAPSVIRFTQQNGNQIDIDICQMVAAHCSDSLVDNGDGSFTHTSIDGTVVVIPTWIGQFDRDLARPADDQMVSGSGTALDPFIFPVEHVSTLMNNGDDTYTYTDEDGTTTLLAFPDTTYDLTDNSDGTVSLRGIDGSVDVIDICAIIAANCPSGIDLLTDDGVQADGSYQFTHTSSAGVAVIVNIPGDVVTTLTDTSPVGLGANSFTYTNENGTVVPWTESISNIIVNNDGSFTYTNEAGTPVNVDVCDLLNDATCTDSLTGPVVDPSGDLVYTHTALDGTAQTIIIPSGGTSALSAPVVDAITGEITYTHTAGDGSIQTIVIPAASGSEYEYVALDPLTHIAGSPIEGNGSALTPYQIPLGSGDVCTELAALPVGTIRDCNDANPTMVVTSDCETVPLPATPQHIFASVSEIGADALYADLSTGGGGTPIPQPQITGMNLIEFGGPSTAGGSGINVGLVNAIDSVPLTTTVTVPAASAGCMMAIQLVWASVTGSGFGEDALMGIYADMTPTTLGANITNVTRVFGDDFATNPGLFDISLPNNGASNGSFKTHSTVFLMDNATGAGGDFEITFPQPITNAAPSVPIVGAIPGGAYDGALNWLVYEICGVEVADFGATQFQTINGGDGTSYGQALGGQSTIHVAGTPGTPGMITFDEYVNGPCDALNFGWRRHAAKAHVVDSSFAANPDGPGAPVEYGGGAGVDAWIVPTGPGTYNRVTQKTSWDSVDLTTGNRCQLASNAGYIKGGTGNVTLTDRNDAPAATAFADQAVGQFIIPIATCPVVVGGTNTAVPVGTTASLDITNNICVDSIQKLQVTGGVCLTVTPGSELAVWPVLNGVALTSQIFSYSNPASSTDDVKVCSGLNYAENLTAVITAGATAGTATLSWEAQLITEGGTPANNLVELKDFKLDTELVHV